jgi:hypothetical protein
LETPLLDPIAKISAGSKGKTTLRILVGGVPGWRALVVHVSRAQFYSTVREILECLFGL